MEHCYNVASEDDSSNSSQKIIMHPIYLPKSSTWLELRVFYVRLSNCEVDDCTPEHLNLNHIPLTPDTILEVNGRNSSIHSDCISSLLRRDRIDKNSDEATFVSTDSIRMTGSVRFEVYDSNKLLLSGVLELFHGNGDAGEFKNHGKKWKMKCRSMITAGSSFLKGKQCPASDIPLPTVEVYVAGCFSSAPFILTKTLQLGVRKQQQMKVVLGSMPEYDSSDVKKEAPSEDALQLPEYQGYKPGDDVDIDYNHLFSTADYIEEEDGQLSWFNAGVRVGVGIGLGVCLGVGIGVGLLVRTYQATTSNFRRRLL